MTENTTTTDQGTPERQDDRPIRIVILQRGWIFVGRIDYDGDDMYVLHDASVIRFWGTKKGLGEIATGGPITDKTVLDPAGTVRFHVLTIVAQLDADYEKWTKVL